MSAPLAIEVGSWSLLPSEGGSALAIAGDRVAVAGPSRLLLWQRGQRLLTIDAITPSPGTPRISADHVYFGPGVVTISSRTYAQLRNAIPEDLPLGHSDRPTVYAWSDTGHRLLASYWTHDLARPSKGTLFDGTTGEVVASLWAEGDVAPEAAWVGQRIVVVGFRDLRIWSADGARIGRIALDAANVVQIAADAHARRLIVVDLNRSIALIDLASLEVRDAWTGAWADAAIAPDGRWIVGLDTAGMLHFASVVHDRFVTLGQASGEPGTTAVGVSEALIAIVGSGELRTADLSVRG